MSTPAVPPVGEAPNPQDEEFYASYVLAIVIPFGAGLSYCQEGADGQMGIMYPMCATHWSSDNILLPPNQED